MDLDNFIKVFDNCLSPYATANFIKFTKRINFLEQRIGGGTTNAPLGIVDKKVRDVSGWTMSNQHKSISEAHWFNLFSVGIMKIKNMYEKEFPDGANVSRINDVTLLKYEEGQHYKVHSDYFTPNPRLLSFIWCLNNDYEGGELNFHSPRTGEIEKTIKPAVNRVIVFPSNFMFPHSISKITKGTRYSIVSWMS